MSTAQITERDAFNAFIDRRWGGNLNGMSLEEALRDFRAYQSELALAQSKIQEALQSSDRGESEPMDDSRLEAIFENSDARLRAKGIVD
jgi:hypothetical protein